MSFEQNYVNENNATSIHAVNKESPVQILHSTALCYATAMLPIHLQGAKIEESWEMQW